MESFLPDSVKAILLGIIATGFVLNRLAHWLPHVGWLQIFRLPASPMSEQEKERRRRSANRLSGLEIVGAGLILPLVYFGLGIMFFNEPGALELVIVAACSVACITLGIWVFVRNL